MKPNKRKLKLVKESLQPLSPQTLGQVAGGQTGTTRCIDAIDTGMAQSDTPAGG